MTHEQSSLFQIPELYYSTLFKALPGHSILVKSDAPTFTILAATQSYLTITGYSSEQLIGKGTTEAFPENKSENGMEGGMMQASFAAVVEKKTPQDLPVQQHHRKNGDGSVAEKYWKVSNQPVFSTAGDVAYIIHTVEDITAQIKAEKKEEAFQKLQKAFDNIQEREQRSYALLNAITNVIFCMSADWLEMRELQGREFLSDTAEPTADWLRKYIPINEQPLFENAIRKAVETKSTFEVEHRVIQKDGAQGWALSRAIPIPDDNGAIVEWFGAISNITQRKQEEDVLRFTKEVVEQQKRVYETITSNTPDLIYVFDLNYRFTYANEALLAMWGKSWDVAVGKGLLENGYEPWHAEMHHREIDQVIATKKPIRGEVSFPHATLGKRIYDYIFVPVLNTEGEVEAIAGTTRDITEIKMAEEAILEKDRDLRNIIQAAPVAMLILRGEEMIVDTINERMLEMIRKTADIVNKPLLEALPELKGQNGYKSFLKVYKEGKPVYGNEILIPLLREGVLEDRYFNFAYTPIIENGKVVGVMDVAMEVTEQVEARKKIEESKQELQLAIEVADLGTFQVDLIHDRATYSQRVMDWFGFTEQGLSMKEIPLYVHPEDRTQMLAELENSYSPESDGLHDVTYRVVHPREKVTRHLRSYGKVLFNKEGKPYLMTGAIQDISAQMRYQQQLQTSEADLQRRVVERTMELETLNEELQRSNANLEEFAYAASHDMKEPIRKIHFFSDRLKTELADNLTNTQKGLFDRMEQAAQRMGALIDDLLMYSHVSRGISHLEKVDLNQSLQNVLEDLELEIQQKEAKISVDSLPIVTGHRRQIQQLFHNLLGNALKYNKPGIAPEIHVRSQPVHGADASLHLTGKDAEKNYHMVTVEDNGIGFDQSDAERIFQVFTRLHGNAEYKGTGVGLSIAQKVVQNHGGKIWAESKPGEGSIFKVLLP